MMNRAFMPHGTLAFSRQDNSVLGHWWWTVDRWLLAALILLMGFGALLVMSASPPVAERLGTDSFHFIYRQFFFLFAAFITLIGVSLMEAKWIRRCGVLGFLAAIVILIATPFFGTEIKGATRWISLGPVSLQPSEILKPCFAIMAAWMFEQSRLDPKFPGNVINIGLLCLVIVLLMTQPDLGQTMLITVAWSAQFFVAGLPLALVSLLACGGLAIAIAAYFIHPHVKSRVDRFLDPSSGDNYQIERSMEAFRNGGLYGAGPGEGSVKNVLPDAHSDFIFAVAGEEFGLLFCLAIVVLFVFAVIRGLVRIHGEKNLFVVLAVSGLLVQFGLQAIVNMASSLQLIPPKGMTLPFISYGGSSTLALAVGMGAVLALTRKGSGTRL